MKWQHSSNKFSMVSVGFLMPKNGVCDGHVDSKSGTDTTLGLAKIGSSVDRLRTRVEQSQHSSQKSELASKVPTLSC